MKSEIIPRFWVRAPLVIVASVFMSCLFFCTPLNASPAPTTLPPFPTDLNKFIAIAKPYVPIEVFNRGYFYNGLAGNTKDNYVIVTFKMGSTVTKQELGWQDGPDTKFTNAGYLPPDTFNELQFKIDVATETLILKEAIDRAPGPVIYLGPGPTPNPLANIWLWPMIAASVVLIGAIIALWSALRLKRSKNVTS